MTRSPPITAHLLRLRRLADGGEGEGGPVEAVDVLGREGVVALQTSKVRLLKSCNYLFRLYRVNPFVISKSYPVTYCEEEAGIPVNYYQNQKHNLQNVFT